ncbi:hypothetical protein EC957_010254 [Mortierella hygrophila]|uniref:Uncharacterized protein n=1 Tax=Mortierella hygrophila TaxID=979708 RepID=A0A9P6JXQ7_9FUNG|nr:hypothetical protein EC957_010254 [Mortierella hygrophila]
MNQVQALRGQINLAYRRILDLERTEANYLRMFQIQLDEPNGEVLFDATPSNQDDRNRLYDVRNQIYDVALNHARLIESLQEFDATLADELRFPVAHSMLQRFHQLHREVRVYIAQQGAAMQTSLYNANKNHVLMAKITQSFNFSLGHQTTPKGRC